MEITRIDRDVPVFDGENFIYPEIVEEEEEVIPVL